MFKLVRKVGIALAIIFTSFLVLLGTTAPASALHNGEKLTNSTSSDASFYVYPDGYFTGARRIAVAPGATYTLNSGDYSPANLKVAIFTMDSFRVRNDATSGAYGSCQAVPGDGKIFTPGDHTRVTFLLYSGASCQHN